MNRGRKVDNRHPFTGRFRHSHHGIHNYRPDAHLGERFEYLHSDSWAIGYSICDNNGIFRAAVNCGIRPHRATLSLHLDTYCVRSEQCSTRAKLLDCAYCTNCSCSAAARFLGVGSDAEGKLVAKEKAGKAISQVYIGVTAALLFGLPLVTVLGDAFGWRGAF